ncbi:MAG: nucleotide-binding domain containing protein, partial [Pusillimonas sp.]
STPARLGVAGGDTSSLALKALDAWGLSYIGQVDPGAALCRMHSDLPRLSGIEIMLKGGQMGTPSVFEKLLIGR